DPRAAGRRGPGAAEPGADAVDDPRPDGRPALALRRVRSAPAGASAAAASLTLAGEGERREGDDAGVVDVPLLVAQQIAAHAGHRAQERVERGRAAPLEVVVA